MTGTLATNGERGSRVTTNLKQRDHLVVDLSMSTLSAFHELENHDAFLVDLALIYCGDILLIATINHEPSYIIYLIFFQCNTYNYRSSREDAEMVPAWCAAGPRPALQESLQCPKCCSGKLRALLQEVTEQ